MKEGQLILEAEIKHYYVDNEYGMYTYYLLGLVNDKYQIEASIHDSNLEKGDRATTVLKTRKLETAKKMFLNLVAIKEKEKKDFPEIGSDGTWMGSWITPAGKICMFTDEWSFPDYSE